jgi:hypothetical protein
MIDLHQHIPMEHLRGGEDLVDRLDRRAWNFGLIQQAQPRVGSAIQKDLSKDTNERCSMLDPVGVLGEASIVGQFGSP